MTDKERWQDRMARQVEQSHFLTFTFFDKGRCVSKLNDVKRAVVAKAIRAIPDDKK